MYKILLLFFLFISASKANIIDNEDDRLCMATDNITWECNSIPKEIPLGFSRVRIMNILKKDQGMLCDESSFSNTDNIVEYVEIVNEFEKEADIHFESNCFTDLKRLREIRIHSDREFYLPPDVFLGLHNVETLDLSRCVRVFMDTLLIALDGRKKLTNLKHLILSSTGILFEPYRLDNTNIDYFAPNISYIKMSKMELSHFNFTAVVQNLHNLEILDLSFSNIYDLVIDGLTKSDLKNLKVVDVSFVRFSMHIIGFGRTLKFRNLILTPQRNSAKIVSSLFTVETINLTGIVPTDTTSIWVYNCTFYIDFYQWDTKHLILQQNNLKRLDAELKCNNSNLQSLITLSLSHNGMEYIHPSIFYCMANLEDIRMAYNSLFEMINENVTMFENLFRLSHSLKHIDLSHNDLTFIPYKTFGQNHRLEKINISNNRLEQLHLNLEKMKHLRVLDLSNNKLKILDTLSFNILKAISVSKLANLSASKEPIVVLSFNPFSCSTCDSRDFIRWLTVTKSLNIESQAIMCMNENGDEEYIRKSTLDDVHNICNRTLIIIVASGSCGLCLLLVVIVIKVILLHRRKKQNDNKRAQVIAKVQNGIGPFEYLAMLSYSAEDEEFATKYIRIPLNNYLKELFVVNRDLILTGGKDFRPGLTIINEISSSLERCSVVLFLVSETFCSSTYCTSEFDEARRLKKPSILMFKEIVDEHLMTPGLRTLYKTNTRIIWTTENGDYKLTTTWENVCTSIIDILLSTV